MQTNIEFLICMKNQFYPLKMKLDIQNDDQIPSNLKILSITWNLVGTIPPQKQLESFFSSDVFKNHTDIILIGTQQCQRSLFWSFCCQSKQIWEQTMQDYIKTHVMVASQTLGGLHNAVFVNKNHQQNAKIIKKQVLRAGFCGLFGNKGAVSIKIKLYGQYIQFINCHLAPHQNGSQHRNEILLKILNNMVCKDLATQVIILGDMNYRIQMKNNDYKAYLKSNIPNTDKNMNYTGMFKIQQLKNQQTLKDKFFPFFQEGIIKFPPSYKLSIDGDQYCRERVPGWTDRIFYRKGKIRQLDYGCKYFNYGSDHRPVYSHFDLQVEEGLSMFEDEQFDTNQCALI